MTDYGKPAEKKPPSKRAWVYWGAALGLLLALAACALALMGPRRQTPPLPIPTAPELSARERAKAGLPPPGELVPAAPADVARAAQVGDDVRVALKAFLKPMNAKWKIVAARPVGDHLLLWIGFPEIRDGGIDLIYSKKSKAIVGRFSGGWRG